MSASATLTVTPKFTKADHRLLQSTANALDPLGWSIEVKEDAKGRDCSTANFVLSDGVSPWCISPEDGGTYLLGEYAVEGTDAWKDRETRLPTLEAALSAIASRVRSTAAEWAAYNAKLPAAFDGMGT